MVRFAERNSRGCAAIGGFFTPDGAADVPRKESRVIDGRLHVFEKPLRAEVSLLVLAPMGDPSATFS